MNQTLKKCVKFYENYRKKSENLKNKIRDFDQFWRKKVPKGPVPKSQTKKWQTLKRSRISKPFEWAQKFHYLTVIARQGGAFLLIIRKATFFSGTGSLL